MTLADSRPPVIAMRLTTPKLLLGVAIGVFVGTFFWAGIRAGYYQHFDIRAQMSPMMFIVFAPVTALILFLPVALLEVLLSSYWWRPVRIIECVALGGTYSMVLAGLVEPWLLVAAFLINPIFLRMWFVRSK